MTLLVARQCRLLGAPHGAVGALRRLQQPAVTVAARSYADEARADAAEAPRAPARVYPNRRLDLTRYKQHQNDRDKRLRKEYFKQYLSEENTQHRNERKKRMKESTYLLTPKYEDSETVSVNSAILIPASVTTAVSVPASLI
ncbi:hypothetical protein BU25DRAFT_35224 [Macroventuria anomochaeta]|uniref:Uncharacterized protein n=1 Tax=Macroventuria anomochaeta TaxID=301207 RepID=A0ACB6S364_9PLEO|nr:uncharacterized protein BU25DRAFT_35224 [Macroventuria anomochaeta]KAF2628412.1 hypothetical protein BU25DRAFT_35224 [Macroventuria anomochaeta]